MGEKEKQQKRKGWWKIKTGKIRWKKRGRWMRRRAERRMKK